MEVANVVATTPKSAAKMRFISKSQFELSTSFGHRRQIYTTVIPRKNNCRGIVAGFLWVIWFAFAEGAVAEAAERRTQ